MIKLRHVFIGAALSCTTWLAHAGGISALEQFVQKTRSGDAAFTQTVTSPKRQGEEVQRQKTSSGRFTFLRPDRFRFVYARPFEQVIVADGHTLWFFDADLNQVTKRDQQQALGSTPAALIASSTDMGSVRKSFELKDVDGGDGLAWLEARPKRQDGQVELVRMGFDGDRLARLEITDGLGQVSVLAFSGWNDGASLKPDDFLFEVPQGADVISQ
ncbi:outer membrane lipoprotein chaperone LolA [Hydrogenophaga sp. 5NK40-0174]|uniref:outer membrane lipoprotein chaperone LolA n=1 Tax=Hydrogenophaga sp. 5NK40-0174 TaxID=3127649 RepID=UPI003108EBF9